MPTTVQYDAAIRYLARQAEICAESIDLVANLWDVPLTVIAMDIRMARLSAPSTQDPAGHRPGDYKE